MKRIVVYSIVVFWLVMAGLFIRREVIPRFFAVPAPGYGSIRAYAQSHPLYRMGIFAPDEKTRIGTTETTYQLKQDGTCEINSRTEVDFRKHPLAAMAALPTGFPADIMKLEIESYATVRPDNALQSFHTTFRSGKLFGMARGVVQGGSLHLTVTAGGQVEQRVIPVTKEDLIASEFTAIGTLPRPHVGQVWQFKMLDPLKFEFTTVEAKVTRKTDIQLRGVLYSVYEVEFTQGAYRARAWADSSGEILKQEALQIIMIREPLPHETPDTLTTEPAAAK